jgi:hypothetical protein
MSFLLGFTICTGAEPKVSPTVGTRDVVFANHLLTLLEDVEEFEEFASIVNEIHDILPTLRALDKKTLNTYRTTRDAILANPLLTEKRLDTFTSKSSIEPGDDSYCDSCPGGVCWTNN